MVNRKRTIVHVKLYTMIYKTLHKKQTIEQHESH